MTRISFGILLVLLGVVVEGYSNDGMEHFLPVLIALSMRLKLFLQYKSLENLHGSYRMQISLWRLIRLHTRLE